MPTCYECQSLDVEWHEVPGTGEVFTWTTTHYAAGPGYEEYSPYSVAVILLDGTKDQDILMVTHLVNIDADDIEFGMPVTVVWEEVEEGITLPLFQPTG